MPDTIIESVLTGKLDSVLLIKWLNNEAIEVCNLKTVLILYVATQTYFCYIYLISG